LFKLSSAGGDLRRAERARMVSVPGAGGGIKNTIEDEEVQVPTRLASGGVGVQ